MQNGLIALDGAGSTGRPAETRSQSDPVCRIDPVHRIDGGLTDDAPGVDPVPQLPERLPVRSGWRFALPLLSASRVTLREAAADDVRPIVSMLSREELASMVSPYAPTREGTAQFIAWARVERAAGRLACFAIVPAGCRQAAGLLQIRPVEGGFETAAWTFAMAAQFRGTGVFQEAAALAADFAFDALGVHRLEARASSRSGRANGALHKLGAVQEGVLRRSLRVGGEFVDQILWAIVREDWRSNREHEANRTPLVH